MNKPLLFKCIFLLLSGFCACNSFTNKRANILPLDSVAVIVADCYFLESEIYVKQWKFDMKDYALVKYDSFFEQHGITKEIFANNVRYYFTNEKYAEKIMSKVDEIIEQRVDALRDSLNRE